jgi:homoserine O-succinyltransferase
MPIRIPNNLPARETLQKENVFCISSSDAADQDMRPLRILILNLMPKKIETEIHLLRMLANSPIQLDVELMRVDNKPSKNTPIEHMDAFYKSYDEIQHEKYDGLIITGAPLGQIDFSSVSFWPELTRVLDWSLANVTSTMFLCWGVQAAMYHLYGIQKTVLDKKISGVYPHHLINPLAPIVRGFDDVFNAPHSRYAEVPLKEILKHDDLELIAESTIAGPYIVARKDGKQLFVTGHSEYEPLCLKDEYERDLQAGNSPTIPENYFPNNDPAKDPLVTWKSHGNLLFLNWLNYYVYQKTPFNPAEIGLSN